jgi:hypothetical protein
MHCCMWTKVHLYPGELCKHGRKPPGFHVAVLNYFLGQIFHIPGGLWFTALLCIPRKKANVFSLPLPPPFLSFSC